MLHIISNFVKTILPTKRKQTSSGWTSFSGPCCLHNGQTTDTRGRAGLIVNADGGISYSCFNCNFKASYQTGRHLTFKFRKLLSWLGAADSDIKRLVIEAIRIKDMVAPTQDKVEVEEKIEFNLRALPDDAITLDELQTFFALVNGDYDKLPVLAFDKVRYVLDRKIDISKYQFYISDSVDHKLDKRVIIPCHWEDKLIGYTARAITDDVKPKYYSQYEPNFVFNTNVQGKDWKFVIVCEGPFDAMAIDGVAILGNEVSEQQADIIDALGREVIVVADADSSGVKLIDAAIKYGWNVAYPVWQEDPACKDINAAVVKYGKLFVLRTILDAVETSKLKIELMKRKRYN